MSNNNFTTKLIAQATGYENLFGDKVISIESNNNTISIRFLINANMAHYSIDMVKVFAVATYNINTNKVAVITENAPGSRKYNHNIKNTCQSLVSIFVTEVNKMITVETREQNSKAYDQCHIELLSMIDSSDSYKKNICFEYINQIMDMYQAGASAEGMLTKLIDVKKEMLADVRLFPVNNEVVINKYNETEVNTIAVNTESFTAFNRSFPSYNEAYNFCLTCDFDPSYIVSEPSHTPSDSLLKLDLQLFSSIAPESPETTQEATRNVYESNYDTVSIQTINGEIIARIHPSEEHSNMHKVCYSSDDYIYIPDSDIISVSPISYTKSRTKKGITYRNFGTSLELSYIIETTKFDDEPNINYFNITKKVCSNLNSVFDTFNLWQKQGYKNISVGTIVKQNEKDIIDDYSDTLEAAINNSEMDRLKKQKDQLNSSLQEIKQYQEFMEKWNITKQFNDHIKEQQSINKDQSGLYWYEMTLRPLSPFCQPKNHIEYDDTKGRHGIVAYDRQLTVNELEEYELRKWDVNK